MGRIKRQRGFLTIAQNSGDIDYLKMAYALGISIRNSQMAVPYLSVIISKDMIIPDKYREVFDEVIELSWDDATNSSWKIDNKWKIIFISPYEETIFLDCDMLFPTNIDTWWNTLSDRDIWFSTSPRTYRGGVIKNSAYREAFRINGLPNIYTTFMYFKQNEIVFKIAEVVKNIMHNWENLKNYYNYRNIPNDGHQGEWTHFINNFPDVMSGDFAYALALKTLGIDNLYGNEELFPSFVHMKVLDQNLTKTYDDDWTKIVPHSIKDDMSFLVGNHLQYRPFHYVTKNFITDELLYKLENFNA